MSPELVEIISSRICEMSTFSGTRLTQWIFQKWIFARMSTNATSCEKATCWFVKVEKWAGRQFSAEADWFSDFRRLCTGLDQSMERKFLAFFTTLFGGQPS